MAWCEANGVDFLFGLAKNERLIAGIGTELDVVARRIAINIARLPELLGKGARD
jgi:hypothetical protein